MKTLTFDVMLCGMAIVKDTMPVDKICRILKSMKHEGNKV